MSEIPNPEGYELIESPDWASCECGGRVIVRVWGEGIDSEIWCDSCDNEDIYR